MIYVHIETSGRVYIYGPFPTVAAAEKAAQDANWGDYARIVETHLCGPDELV